MCVLTAVPGFYPKGVVLHRNWRPHVGYEPVDTSSVDALRPKYQRDLIQVLVRFADVCVCVCVCMRMCVCLRV